MAEAPFALERRSRHGLSLSNGAGRAQALEWRCRECGLHPLGGPCPVALLALRPPPVRLNRLRVQPVPPANDLRPVAAAAGCGARPGQERPDLPLTAPPPRGLRLLEGTAALATAPRPLAGDTESPVPPQPVALGADGANRTLVPVAFWRRARNATLLAGPTHEVTHATAAGLVRQRIGAAAHWARTTSWLGVDGLRVYELGRRESDRSKPKGRAARSYWGRRRTGHGSPRPWRFARSSARWACGVEELNRLLVRSHDGLPLIHPSAAQIKARFRPRPSPSLATFVCPPPGSCPRQAPGACRGSRGASFTAAVSAFSAMVRPKP